MTVARFAHKLPAAVALLVVVAAWVGWRQAHRPAPTGADAQPGTVVDVVDGDTIDVAGVGRVRLLLVDTPETRDNSHGPKGCFGVTAKRFVADLIPPGTPVELVTDRDTHDRYGRLLAYVESGGVDVGEELLRRGLAEVLYIAPNRARLDRYQSVAADAERAEVGIWGPECRP